MKKVVDNNFIYKNFLTSIKDLKKIKIYFLFSLFLFFIVFLSGLFLPIFFEDQILKLIKELVAKTQGLGIFGLIRFIIANNVQSAFFGMILGIFLGIFPLAVIIINSYILGFVVNKSIISEGMLILWKLFPHGIFEIPAILISVSLGLWIGIFFFSAKDKVRVLFYLLISSLIFIGFSFILLIITYFLIFVTNPALIQSPENISKLTLDFTGYPLIPLISFILLIFSYYLGTFVLMKKDKENLLNRFITSLRIFILIVIPLLVIAGIIEGVLIFLLG